MDAKLNELQNIYEAFCNFGANRGSSGSISNLALGHLMDGAKFAKFARDTKLVDNKKITSTDVDIIFNKVKPKSERKINFDQFQQGIQLLGEKKYPTKQVPEARLAKIITDIIAAGGPIAKATNADASGIYSKLTDTTLYTGTHKGRFDADGKGVGLAGRDQPVKTAQLSQIVNRTGGSTSNVGAAPNKRAVTESMEKMNGSGLPAKKAGPSGSTTSINKTNAAIGAKKLSGSNSNVSGGKPGGAVFDRLTDSKGYTGAHKHRFDAEGKGVGIAGRDSTAKGTGTHGQYRGGDVKNLSQILRS